MTTAVVSGAAAGIGRVVTELLTDQGHACASLDLSDDAAPGVLPVVCDLADPAAVAAAADVVRRELGEPGIVVHCAALQGFTPVAELSLEQWHRTMAVNVDGCFHLVQAFLPAMRAAGCGRIVVVTSSTLFRPPEGMVGYVTTKGALTGMVRALAAEVGVDGVTVNAVAPGLTRSEHAVATVPQQMFEAVRDRQSVKRSGEPADSAAAVAYLVSDAAGFVTGQTLRVDGGESFG